LAIERFPEIQSDPEQLRIILSHNSLEALTTFTDQQKLLIYREYKRLNAINLVLSGDRYEFQFPIGQEGAEALLIMGSIDGRGNIDIQSREPTIATCPICLALETRINTPEGPKFVEDLEVGDTVWTVDILDRRVAAPILRTGRTSAPITHQMIGLLFEDGRQIEASPGYPLPDGRRFRDLRVGDTVDGSRILNIEDKEYEAKATYDILPSSATGWYWANDILLASTLFFLLTNDKRRKLGDKQPLPIA
jgi:hypothetical protein